MFSLVIACSLLASSSSFQLKASSSPLNGIRQSENLALAGEMGDDIPSSTPAPAIPITAVPTPKRKAQWIPLNVYAPAMLDGTMAGDVGFDPLGFAKSKQSLYWMREAEIKHSRLAMLAAVGWPISELWHKEIANTFGWESILQSGGRAPSLFNGGLSNGYATGMLIMSIIIAGTLEGIAMNSGEIFWSTEKSADYIPGDYKFDPLNLKNIRGRGIKDMQTAEIKNGRVAMLAITGFAVAEFINREAVVSLTPFFF